LEILKRIIQFGCNNAKITTVVICLDLNYDNPSGQTTPIKTLFLLIVIKKILQHDKPEENNKKFTSKHNFREKKKNVLKAMKMKQPEKKIKGKKIKAKSL
jgi:hypothetical protein